MQEEEEDVTQEMNVQRRNGSMREEDVTQKISVRRQDRLAQEVDVLQEAKLGIRTAEAII